MALNETFVAILLQLPQQDLLVSVQRVCKRWNQIIHDSPAIRRHLFIDSADTTTRVSTHRILNPLLTKAFPSLFEQTAPERPTAETRVRRNRLNGLFRDSELCKRMGEPGGERVYDTDVRDGLAAQEKMNPFLRSDASWLRMHISDPPVRHVCVQYCLMPYGNQAGARDSYHFVVPIDGQGLRMGDLHSSLLAAFGPSMMYGLVWPLQVPGTQDAWQCELDNFKRTEGGDADKHHHVAHVEPDLVVAIIEIQHFFPHSHGPLISKGEVFCIENLVKNQYGNFIASEINKRRPETFALDPETSIWPNRCFH